MPAHSSARVPGRRGVLFGGLCAALAPYHVLRPQLAQGAQEPRRARLRPPGPAESVAVDPPQSFHPDAARVFGTSRLQRLYDGASWAEGPVWWPARRTLVFSDVVGRRVLGWREDGAVDALIDVAAFINGNAVDREGRLVHCEHGRRAVSRSETREAELGDPVTLATHADGTRLNAPNDLVVAADGAIWFTEPTFGIVNPKQGYPAPSESERSSVCRLVPGAREAVRMADMVQPNGLGFSPDGATLYVTQTPEGEDDAVGLFAFRWDGTRLSDRRRFARVEAGVPDGIAIDRRGWVWSSSGAGVEVFDPRGQRLARVPTPGLCSNCAFDAEERRLFVTGNDSLWVIALQA